MAGSSEPNGRQSAVTIQTPEGVSFSLPLAGPVSRFLAWSLDMACLTAGAVVVRMVSFFFGIVSPDISGAFSIVLFFVLNMAYSMLLEWYWNGQTIGKRVMGLRVMDMGGLALQPSQIIIRNLLRAADSLPMLYLLGGTAALLSRFSQRLGDMTAGTVVTAVLKTATPGIDMMAGPNHFNSMGAYPHLAARLRQKTLPEEAALAFQALLRRDELLPESRLALFERLAAHFRQKVAFPEEALTGISDEQYVRNVVALLYRD